MLLLVYNQLKKITYVFIFFKKPPTTIRLFNRTEYYTVHGSDTILASNEIFRTTSFVKSIGSGNFFSILYFKTRLKIYNYKMLLCLLRKGDIRFTYSK